MHMVNFMVLYLPQAEEAIFHISISQYKKHQSYETNEN